MAIWPNKVDVDSTEWPLAYLFSNLPTNRMMTSLKNCWKYLHRRPRSRFSVRNCVYSYDWLHGERRKIHSNEKITTNLPVWKVERWVSNRRNSTKFDRPITTSGTANQFFHFLQQTQVTPTTSSTHPPHISLNPLYQSPHLPTPTRPPTCPSKHQISRRHESTLREKRAP